MRLGFLWLPRYPVQRRVLEQPSLAGKPVVLYRELRGAQRVCFASGAALRRGIKPGLSLAAAGALEPAAVQVRYDESAERAALASLGEAMLPISPGFQVEGPEGLWLDASAASLCGGEAGWGERVLSVCRALGVSGRCVVGAERFTTQALARFCTVDPVRVLPERGGGALAKVPLAALEEGWLGPDAAAPFRALGLTTLGEVAGLAAGALVARFGAMGAQAARLCRGEDDSGFVADPLREVLEESMQLEWPAEQLEPVLFALKMIVDRVCGRLQGRQQAAVRLVVTMALEGAPPLVVPLVLARPSSQGRMVLELTRHRLMELTVPAPIVGVMMRVEESSAEVGRQLLLGDAPAGEAALEVVVSRLQSALGEAALFSARPAASHRPETAWSTERFSPPATGPGGEFGGGVVDVSEEEGVEPMAVPRVSERGATWPKRKAKVEQQPVVSFSTLSTRPSRLFREPSRVRAELDSAGSLAWVNVGGRRRRVEAVWGPERLVGAWWEASYARDYYRVQLDGLGTLWLFRDGRDGEFFVQGVFD